MATPAQRIPLRGTSGVTPLASATAVAAIAAQIVTETSIATNIGGNRQLSIYVTDVAISNSAGTAAVVSLLDGVTVIWAINLAATSSNFACNFTTPLKCTAGNALNIQSSSASANINWNVCGYAAST
jgi:hypothetical protein